MKKKSYRPFTICLFLLCLTFCMSGQTAVLSLDNFKKTDFYNYFKLVETDRKTLGNLTEISYRLSGAYKDYSELQVYLDVNNQVRFGRQTLLRSFINAYVDYDMKLNKAIIVSKPDWVNVDANDEVKSFIATLLPYTAESKEQVQAILVGILLKRDTFTKFTQIKPITDSDEVSPEIEECIATYVGENDHIQLSFPLGTLEMTNKMVNNQKALVTTIRRSANQMKWAFASEKSGNTDKRLVYKKVGATFYLTLAGQKFEPLSSQIIDMTIDGNRCRIELKGSAKNSTNALKTCLNTEEELLTCDNRKVVNFLPIKNSIIEANQGLLAVSSTPVMTFEEQEKFVYTVARPVANDILVISTYAPTNNDRNAINRLEKIIASYKYETNNLTQSQIDGDTLQIDGMDILEGLNMYKSFFKRDGYVLVNKDLARGKDKKMFKDDLVPSNILIWLEEIILILSSNQSKSGKGDAYFYNAVTVFDGKLVHAIHSRHFNTQDTTIEIIDTWGRDRSFLEEKNNLAGVKAIKTKGGFKVKEAEFKKVLYSIVVDAERFDTFLKLLEDASENMTETVKSIKKATIKTPDTIYYREHVMNDVGYVFLRHQEYKKALTIFKLNSLLHPISANAYDSLAEAYMASKDKPNAIAMYKKVLEVLSLDNNITEKFREQLKNNAETSLKKL